MERGNGDTKNEKGHGREGLKEKDTDVVTVILGL
jgi:hypothetical protein